MEIRLIPRQREDAPLVNATRRLDFKSPEAGERDKAAEICAFLENVEQHFHSLTQCGNFPRLKKSFDAFYKFEADRTMKTRFSEQFAELRGLELQLRRERQRLVKDRTAWERFRRALHEEAQMTAEDLRSAQARHEELVGCLEAAEFSLRRRGAKPLPAKKTRALQPPTTGKPNHSQPEKLNEAFSELKAASVLTEGPLKLNMPFDVFAEEMVVKVRQAMRRAGIRDFASLDKKSAARLTEIYEMAGDENRMVTHTGYLDASAVESLREKILALLSAIFAAQIKRLNSKTASKELQKHETKPEADLCARIETRAAEVQRLLSKERSLALTLTNLGRERPFTDLPAYKENEDVLLYRVGELNEAVFGAVLGQLKEKSELFGVVPLLCFCSKFKLEKAVRVLRLFLGGAEPTADDDIARARRQARNLIASLRFNVMFRLLWREARTAASPKTKPLARCEPIDNSQSQLIARESMIGQQNDSSFISSEAEMRELWRSSRCRETSLDLAYSASPLCEHSRPPASTSAFRLPDLHEADIKALCGILEAGVTCARLATEPAPARRPSSPPRRKPSPCRLPAVFARDVLFFEGLKALVAGATLYLKTEKVRSVVAFNPFKTKPNGLARCGFSPFCCKLQVAQQELAFTPGTRLNRLPKTLPLRFIRKTVVQNNTRDFIRHMQRGEGRTLASEESLFEMVVFCFSSDRLQLVIPGHSLFERVLCFFERCGQDKSCLSPAAIQAAGISRKGE